MNTIQAGHEHDVVRAVGALWGDNTCARKERDSSSALRLSIKRAGEGEGVALCKDTGLRTGSRQ